MTEREVTIMLRHDLRKALHTVEHGRGVNMVYYCTNVRNSELGMI